MIVHLSDHGFDAIAVGNVTCRACVIHRVGSDGGELGSVAGFDSLKDVARSRKVFVVAVVSVIVIASNEREAEEC